MLETFLNLLMILHMSIYIYEQIIERLIGSFLYVRLGFTYLWEVSWIFSLGWRKGV